MAIAEFELIVLENGDVGLQRVGSDELLVRVKFRQRFCSTSVITILKLLNV